MHLVKSRECHDISYLSTTMNNNQNLHLVDTETVVHTNEDHDNFTSNADSIDDETIMIDKQLPSTLHYGMEHTNDMYYDCKLLQILDKANAQHFLFKQIMDWAREAAANNYKFQPKCKS